MTKLEFSENVSAICKRPRMYTLHGTLPEVIAHLDGLGKELKMQPGLTGELVTFLSGFRKGSGKRPLVAMSFSDVRRGGDRLQRVGAAVSRIRRT